MADASQNFTVRPARPTEPAVLRSERDQPSDRFASVGHQDLFAKPDAVEVAAEGGLEFGDLNLDHMSNIVIYKRLL